MLETQADLMLNFGDTSINKEFRWDTVNTSVTDG